MSDPYVYRSRDAGVIQAWKDAAAAISDYIKTTQAALTAAGLGEYQVYRLTGGAHPGKFAGLAVSQDQFPPEGWRQNRGSQYAVPDKRTKAGREITAKLAGIKHPGDPRYSLTGMPPDVMTPGGFSTPGIRLLEGGAALYLTWRVDPAGCRESFTRGAFEIDRSLWEGPVWLSEYYAAFEAEDAGVAS